MPAFYVKYENIGQFWNDYFDHSVQLGSDHNNNKSLKFALIYIFAQSVTTSDLNQSIEKVKF